MNTPINEAVFTLFKAATHTYSYQEFLALNEQLLSEGKTTSFSDEEKYVNFGKLNYTRMERLNKTLQIDDDTIAVFSKSTFKKWFVITEGWCGDSAQILPYLAHLAEQTNIDLQIILREENPMIMENYLTNGSKSIPILVMLNEEGAQKVWGPRPFGAQELFNHYKAHPEELTFEEFEIQLQKWYNQDKGKAILNELKELLND